MWKLLGSWRERRAMEAAVVERSVVILFFVAVLLDGCVWCSWGVDYYSSCCG